MIRPLRRAHFLAWCALALLLPVAFTAAYQAIPRSVTGPIPARSIQDARDPVVSTLDRPAALYRLRGSSEVGYQIEVVPKRPLRSARLVVQASDASPEAGESTRLFGTVGARGITRIDVGRELPAGFVLRDPIRDEIVETLDFATDATQGDAP